VTVATNGAVNDAGSNLREKVPSAAVVVVPSVAPVASTITTSAPEYGVPEAAVPEMDEVLPLEVLLPPPPPPPHETSSRPSIKLEISFVWLNCIIYHPYEFAIFVYKKHKYIDILREFKCIHITKW
jgi:hypothetical protein